MFGAFIIIWFYRSELLKALAAPVFVLCLLSGLQYYSLDDAGFVYSNLISLLSVILYVFFAISCHRIVLLGRGFIPVYGLKLWSLREFVFLGWIFLIGVLFIIVHWGTLALFRTLPAALGFSTGQEWVYGILAMLHFPVAYIVAIYIIARWSLVFPATAVDNFINLKRSWRATHNNGWRMIVIVIGLPGLMSILVDTFWREDATTFEIVLLSIAGYLLMAIEIAALSLCYKEIVKQSAALQ